MREKKGGLRLKGNISGKNASYKQPACFQQGAVQLLHVFVNPNQNTAALPHTHTHTRETSCVWHFEVLPIEQSHAPL